ncbi:YciI family protein [Sphaerisporangium sp. TRM90804]|uniref:YciI family protein n=1 Tax=Sphaerisporangium sp. TRM90804 TaxID=3031113 RepID=UPI00244CD820|nr:YciI family protein [Sphaerisporangium sp. TRM90804]MDH2430552.1 YciI family protein [Sphaerisporangium sp. TRM90804]
MRYLLLIYSNAENWEHPLFLRDPEFLAMPADDRAELITLSKALHREITESGELITGEGLAAPSTTRSVQVREGVPAVTDGPYGETKEHLAGYLVVDCETPERANEIASRIPDARFAAVEVRPIMDTPTPET